VVASHRHQVALFQAWPRTAGPPVVKFTEYDGEAGSATCSHQPHHDAKVIFLGFKLLIVIKLTTTSIFDDFHFIREQKLGLSAYFSLVKFHTRQ
jgi:hypothetical protein